MLNRLSFRLLSPADPPGGGAPPPPVDPPAQPPAAPYVAAPPQPPAYAPPPPGYAAPPAGYPTPPGYPQPPAAHRVSGALIAGIVVVVMALGGGVATAVALLGHPKEVYPVQPVALQTSPAPAASAAPEDTQPSPEVQPSPRARATPRAQATPSDEPSSPPDETGPSTGATTVDTNNLSIALPSGWQKGPVEKASINVIEPGKGLVFALSGKVEDGTTADSWVQHLLDQASKANSSASLCKAANVENPQATTMVGKPTPAHGVSVAICEVNPKGVQFLDIYYFSLLKGDSGSTYLFEANIYAPVKTFESFLSDAKPVVQSLVWKLLSGSS